MLLPQENPREFQELTAALNEEHRPTTPTETLLVERMIQHFWLSQRAMRLQGFCFEDGFDQPELQKLSVYLRYQSTHDRAFHKCLAELQKLRAEQRKQEKQQAAAEPRITSANPKPVSPEPPSPIQMPQAAPALQVPTTPHKQAPNGLNYYLQHDREIGVPAAA